MKWTALFTPAVRDLDRFSRLAEAVLDQVRDLEAAALALLPGFSPERAAGAQLEMLCDSLGLPPPETETETDESRRERLRAALALSRWDGTNAAVPQVLAEAFPGRDVRLTDNGDLTVTLTAGDPAPPDALLPVPAGVRILR